MGALDLCEIKTIQIATTRGVMSVTAHVMGDLAAHERISGGGIWQITHLPTGLSFAAANGQFPSIEPCVSAMAEIARLRNSWSVLEPSDLPDLRAPVLEIQRRHGGEKPHRSSFKPEFRPNLNGYGEAPRP